MYKELLIHMKPDFLSQAIEAKNHRQIPKG